MFADPAKSGMMRGGALVNWASIHVPLGVEGFLKLGAHGGFKRRKFRAEDFVVIGAPGVAGNPSAGRIFE